jgi:hypothetical protein
VNATASPAARHLTPVDRDALALDLVPAAQREVLLAHLRACARCASLEHQHRIDREHFVSTVYARSLPALPGRVRRRRRSSSAWGAVAGLGALAAAGLLLAPRTEQAAAPPIPAAGAPGIKGPGVLKVFARRGERVFTVAEGSHLAPGDAIRFFVNGGGHDYVIVGSVDGEGKATIYHPYAGRQSVRVAPAEQVQFPGSIILDSARGPERLFAVFSREPLPTERVRSALLKVAAGGVDSIRQTRALALPGTSQATLYFEKDGAPP